MNTENLKLAKIEHVIIEDVVDAYVKETSWGAKIILFVPRSELSAEEIATLQATYSRSNDPIIQRLMKLLEEGKKEQVTGRVMGMSFTGYGHKSIGDLGNILLCYEGVSMLAAKAIQDSQLYNGQEASTRYIGFEKQPFLFPAPNGKLYGTTGDYTAVDDEAVQYSQLATLQNQLRYIYIEWLPQIVQHLKDNDMKWATWPTNPKDTCDKNYQKVFDAWERGVNARAFDIIRGFLPAGCSTNLAWWTSVSHCVDHLGWLRCHVLGEVREIAEITQEICATIYPLSFTGRTLYAPREKYKKDFYKEMYYLEVTKAKGKMMPQFDLNPTTSGYHDTVSYHALLHNEWKKWIETRPLRQELHYSVGEGCVISYDNLLDFASFRDQQRHRAVIQRHGLLTSKHGFHQWYIDNLPPHLRSQAKQLLKSHVQQLRAIKGLTKFERQYYLPMGYKIPTRIVGHLGKIIYLVEQRAHPHVHPTMHANAYDLAMHLKDELQEIGIECPLDINPNVGAISVKRGDQTFFIGGKAMQ